MKYTVLTSINRKYWEDEGVKINLQSWDKFFPKNIEIHVYSEDLQPVEIKLSNRVHVHNLYKECPELNAFMSQYKDDPHVNGDRDPNSYKWKGIKFAHKTFPIFRHARITDGVLVWLDADVLAIQPMQPAHWNSLVPEGPCVNYLGRKGRHSECGFVSYNMRHPQGLDFIKHFESYYYNNKLATIDQTHDSYVFDCARKTFLNDHIFNNMNKAASNDKHPFDKTILRNFFVHTKGDNKDKRVMKNLKRHKMYRWNLHPGTSE